MAWAIFPQPSAPIPRHPNTLERSSPFPPDTVDGSSGLIQLCLHDLMDPEHLEQIWTLSPL